MNCQQLYGQYQNQIIEVEFKPSSEAYTLYGANLIGYLYFPTTTGSPFYENVKISENETQVHQLVRLAFKMTPGFKLKFGKSDETESLLIEKGFSCKDVLRISQSNQVSLVVSGFPDKKNNLSFSVSGVWSFNQQTSVVTISKADQEEIKMFGNEFYSLCNEIRGCKYDAIEGILKKYKINFNIAKTEIDLLKSLCNIFIWLEYYFVEGDIAPDPNKLINNSEFLPKMFDEFIIDYTEMAETQKDIYLIKQQYKFGETQKLLEELVRLNLLSKVVLKVKHNEYANYFIPFTKSEFKELFMERRDLHSLYNSLMSDRNICISTFFKNR